MVSAPDDVSKTEWASVEFKRLKEKTGGRLASVVEEGQAGYVDYDSYFFYGESKENPGRPEYRLVGVAKSGVATVSIVDLGGGEVGDPRLEGDFREKISQIAPRIFGRFVLRIPD
ncbi:hypothetical protein Nans01_11630 [Nocardiopsis ansamitocini]|uniref:Uncharacterized protein n=2 Tax=Nocardiopsis ansamitocini TaxID=1670832 RepID=A0A9W6P486_9ACTN|nr:hypothetical protein Nans01_11630 [Nocardiopsis ansamitocini]